MIILLLPTVPVGKLQLHVRPTFQRRDAADCSCYKCKTRHVTSRAAIAKLITSSYHRPSKQTSRYLSLSLSVSVCVSFTLRVLSSSDRSLGSCSLRYTGQKLPYSTLALVLSTVQWDNASITHELCSHWSSVSYTMDRRRPWNECVKQHSWLEWFTLTLTTPGRLFTYTWKTVWADVIYISDVTFYL